MLLLLCISGWLSACRAFRVVSTALCLSCLFILSMSCGGGGRVEDTDYEPATASRYFPLHTGDVFITYTGGVFVYSDRIRVGEPVVINGVQMFPLEIRNLVPGEPNPERYLTEELDKFGRVEFMSSDERGVFYYGQGRSKPAVSNDIAYSPPLMIAIGGRRNRFVAQTYRYLYASTGLESAQSIERRSTFQGEETVTTQAGTFVGCAKVEHREESSSGEVFTEQTWYAPGVGPVKKREHSTVTDDLYETTLIAAMVEGKKIP